MNKPNCWEYKQCGREPGGANVATWGICPVAQEERLHNRNHGHHAGRMCWLVKAALCTSLEGSGDFINTIDACMQCNFMRLVYQQEGEQFSYGMSLLAELKHPPVKRLTPL